MKHTITIEIYSDIDPSSLLELAQQAGQQIAEEIETYDETATYYEEDVVVATDWEQQ